jgi:protein-S-isoprenylcysteine O-methyltransferase Ste14
MSQSSSSVSRPTTLDASAASTWFEPIKLFLIRRRILLSGILFALLIGQDVAFGPKPHDLANVRDPLSVAGVLMVLSGLALRSWAAGILRKDKELTVTGPYRLIRNPLYVGSFLMMFGFCALIGDVSNVFLMAGPLVVLYVIKVRQEERLLARLFPEQWIEYSRTTPRFFPRLAAADLSSQWRLAQWLHSREFQAVGATALALVAIKVWQVM